MSLPERALRLVTYVVAFLAVCFSFDILARTWCLLFTREGSAQRIVRGNLLTRTWGAWLTELTLRVLRVRLEPAGRVPPGRFLVVCNHQSTADIAILIWALRPLECKFVAKNALGRGGPFVSLAIRRFGSALVSPTGARADILHLRTMARGLERWNGSAIVFAEGTRSRDGHLLPYKKAAVRLLAEEARLPLLPVAIDGTHVAADLPGFIHGMPGARFALTIGEPIPVERWEGRIEDAIDEIRAWTVATIEAGRADGSVPRPAAAAGQAQGDV